MAPRHSSRREAVRASRSLIVKKTQQESPPPTVKATGVEDARTMALPIRGVPACGLLFGFRLLERSWTSPGRWRGKHADRGRASDYGRHQRGERCDLGCTWSQRHGERDGRCKW